MIAFISSPETLKWLLSHSGRMPQVLRFRTDISGLWLDVKGYLVKQELFQEVTAFSSLKFDGNGELVWGLSERPPSGESG